ncbi:MAG TPA: winged helix-turn-helix domain-containing protein [Candidatus Eisenbacteria bacterium]|nr:winged helix-turn-helix domain-containing protein [Candidatus Eisenbacteria bacterium]
MQVPATQWRCARFGPFEADAASHELLRDGRKIKLQEMPFQVLMMLLDHPRQVVTREEFRQKLWPSDTFVDFEHSVNTAVKKLREALEDNAAEPLYVETLPKLGYRFIAPVEEQSREPQRPESQSLDQDVAPREPRSIHGRRRWLIVLAGAATLAGILLFALNVGGVLDRMWQQRKLRGSDKHLESLAVLPLDNLSQDPEQQYFTDGLTDALITDLGKVAGLRVISRTSVMAYKRTSKPLPQIARELDVDAVVEGTVLRSGNRIRVTAQLIKASPERHLWAERYERDTGELISLEQQLALAIAHEISGRLAEPSEMHWPGHTTNERAYDAYLRGRYLWNQRTEAGITEARSYFRQALQEDPNFALAWSGLSDSYSIAWAADPDLALAEEYARKALALAPSLAEAHVSLGFALLRQLNFAEAKAETVRALELDPNSVMARHMVAGELLCMGKPAEALAESDRALQLDPFSFPVNYMRGGILEGLRQYNRAIDQFHTAAAISPESPAPHSSLARLYWFLDRAPEALEEEREQAILSRSAEFGRAVQEATVIYQKSGTAAARQILARAEEDRFRRSQYHDDVAGIVYHYAGLRDRAKTLHWLRKGVQVHDGSLSVVLMTAPEFDWLRSDPEFQQVLRDMDVAE